MLVAVKNGHRSQLDRIRQLISDVDNSSFSNPRLNDCLRDLQECINKSSNTISISTIQLLKSYEYTASEVRAKDRKITELISRIDELELALSTSNFQKVFSDYTSECIQDIIETFEKNNALLWCDFHPKLMSERRTAAKQFRQEHDDLGLESHEFIHELYSKRHHQLLFASAETLGWTEVECDLLFVFNDNRNSSMRSGIQMVAMSQLKTLVATHQKVLEIGVPVGMEMYESMLVKAVEKFKQGLSK